MTAAGLDLSTYSVGDYVWVRRSYSSKSVTLARVADAIPQRRHPYDRLRFRVRLRTPKGWTKDAATYFVERALRPSELAHNRQLGMLEASP